MKKLISEERDDLSTNEELFIEQALEVVYVGAFLIAILCLAFLMLI